MNFDVQTIAASFADKSPLLVTIDGGSGSGKTTLGQELASFLSAPLISLDDFIIEANDDILDKRSPEQNFLTAFDRSAITNTLKEHRDSSSTVIVEGVYSLRPEWADLIDFRIWIEMSPALRLERMKIRQANSQSQMRLWQSTEDWYIKTFNPVESADLIVDGSTGKIMMREIQDKPQKKSDVLIKPQTTTTPLSRNTPEQVALWDASQRKKEKGKQKTRMVKMKPVFRRGHRL
jgi:uridine kinase